MSIRRIRRRFGSRLHLSGRVTILVHDAESGKLTRLIRTHNKIVDDGLAFLIDRAKGDTFQTANYFAVGNHATAPSATDQTLHGEIFRAQISTSRRIGNNQWEVKGFVASGQANGYPLQEFGIFANGETNGKPMLARLVYPIINKTVSSTVTYIWTGTFTAL
jgi:hypothetical protein